MRVVLTAWIFNKLDILEALCEVIELETRPNLAN